MRKQTINLYLGLSILERFSMSFSLAMYVVFLMSHGLNLFDTNLINAFFFSTMLLMEIPTGAFADMFGRKTSFVLGGYLRSLSFLIYGFATNFGGFVVAEIVCAIGSTCENGAFQSWLISRLRHFGHEEKNWSKIFGRAEALSSLAGLLAAYLGSRVADLDLRYPWFLSSAGYFLLATVSSFLMKEEYFQRQKHSLREGFLKMLAIAGDGIKSARANRTVLFLFVIGILQFVCLQAPNMQWQPLFLPFFGKKEALGMIWIAVSLTVTAGSFLAPKLLNRTKNEKKSLMWVQIWIGVGLIISVVTRNLFLMMPAFLFHELMRGMFKPIKDSYLQDSISDEQTRATVSSFESLSRHIGAITGLLISGAIALLGSISVAWMVSGSILILGTILIAKGQKEVKG